MDQRRQPRLDANGPARVTLLGEQKREIAGRAASFANQALKLVLQEPVPAGAPLMVEWEDSEILGEVRYCERVDDGFAVGVSIEHALMGTRELARLASRLLGEGPERPANAPDQTAEESHVLRRPAADDPHQPGGSGSASSSR